VLDSGEPQKLSRTEPDQMNLALRSALQVLVAFAAAGLAACAGQPPGPETGIRGVGTPGVAAYVPADRATSLQAMQANCEGVPPAAPSATQGLPAACDQLRRTLNNQPGNAAQPGYSGQKAQWRENAR